LPQKAALALEILPFSYTAPWKKNHHSKIFCCSETVESANEYGKSFYNNM